MKQLLQFLLSHSIFIAFCAAALCYQTFLLSRIPDNIYIYIFVFFATLSSYNFYWLLSKYSFRGDVPFIKFLLKNKSYIFLFSMASAGMAAAFYFMQEYLAAIILSIFFTLLYSLPLWPVSWARKLRKAGFLKTTLLAFTWAFVTVILPCWPELFTNDSVLFIFTARFFFMLFLCIIFDKRDAVVDTIHKLNSLATDVSTRNLKIITTISYLLFVIVGGIVTLRQTNYTHLAFFALLALVMFYVNKLSASRQKSYVFYYFVVDGLMLLCALQSFVAERVDHLLKL